MTKSLIKVLVEKQKDLIIKSIAKVLKENIINISTPTIKLISKNDGEYLFEITYWRQND